MTPNPTDKEIAAVKDRAELFWFCVMAGIVVLAFEIIL
jgi:hypothetical protein